MKTKAGFCPGCKANRLAEKPEMNHLLHLILTICTGVWGFVWLFLAMADCGVAYRCKNCGHRM